MSDDEDHSSSDGDFSASEDEWKPGKSHRQATEDESDDDDSDFEDDAPSSKKREAKSHNSTSSKSENAVKKTKKRKSTGTSLRTKLFNKYKPPPKTVRNQSTPPKMVEPNRSTAQLSKKMNHAGKKANASDSDSSGDDYLVNPDELDLQSSFFDVKPSTSSESAPPQFDCNAGMNLTDSEQDEDVDETESSKDIANSCNVSKGTKKPVDLGYLQDFAANMEKAKVQYKKQKERSLLVADAKVDVSSLLAMGESTATTSTVSTKKTKHPKRQIKKIQSSQAAADTDSDWEEVEGEIDLANTTRPSDIIANGIQVCVDLPQRQRKDKKASDLEASLKRQLNRIIKENQMYLHKVSLLCHIYHGLFLNKVTNNIKLMPMALKLLPSKNVYPSGQTEIKYFQSMVTWFKTAIKLHDDRVYPKIKLNAVTSLAVQMKHRHAVCKRDYLLIFVILLRAMGMQCRLVINMVPAPLRPAQSSLCSLKMKSTGDDKKEANAAKKVADTTKNEKLTLKKNPIKSPPLSMEAREELRKKVDSLEKKIEKKKMSKLKPKPSFEEELEANVPVPVRTMKTEPKLAAKSKETTMKKEDLKRKTVDNFNDPEKKKKMETTVTKSKFFSDSNKATQKIEQQRLVASLELHSKSFDDQQPSISINSKRISKPVKKSRSQTETKTNPIKSMQKQKVIPDIVIVADAKQNLENITNKQTTTSRSTRSTRSRSKSPKAYISAAFLQTKAGKALHADADDSATRSKVRGKSPNQSGSTSVKSYISTEFLKNKPNIKVTAKEIGSEKSSPRKLRSRTKLTVPQLDGADDLPNSRRKTKLKKAHPNESDDDFQPSPPKRPKAIEKLKKLDRQVLSPDIAEQEQSPSKIKKNAINIWIEVYSELEDQWVCIDLFKGKVNCVDTIRKSVTPLTLAYVFAFNNDATMKDVTPRYCSQWATVVRKSRVEQSWLDEAIGEYLIKFRTQRDLTEDMDLRKIHLDKPMPTTISEYKDNPLYALKRHLLKFQAIYPPNALTLGFVRGEAVYARECVHTLHSREIWLKSARVVKLGEKPYKIVKARPKWDKFTSSVIKDQPLEIFGFWQTQEYEPPTAENGIVPRNAYGNVELFKECMLPKKTVHLHLPGLNKVCKKLGIDCASAVVGFDFHQGACHPLYDGFVVCEEFAELAADAWDKEQQEVERKEQEKYEARVYGNWKKLIRGLLIRERLKLKYNF